MFKKSLSRRTFIRNMTLAGCAGLAVNNLTPRNVFGKGRPAAKAAGTTSMEYRTLGRTGLKVSAVSFGVMRLGEPAVLHEALDRGINFFDTAHSYQGGNNEKMLGKVLKQYGRQKVYVATKIPPFYRASLGMLLRDKASMEKLLDESLKRLQTDYVDVLFLHNIKEPGWSLHQDLMAFAEQARKKGKARFVGISFHASGEYYVNIVDKALQTDIYDVYLATLNFKSPQSHLTALNRARKRNIGIVAMKTQAGGYAEPKHPGLNPHQAALRWSLDQPFVDCSIPGMVNRRELHENIAALETKTGWAARKTLASYYESVRDRLCVRCGGCDGTCAKGVSIPDVNRALMYYEGYGDFAFGKAAYNDLPSGVYARMCLECDAPTCRCSNGINLKERMRYAHTLFA